MVNTAIAELKSVTGVRDNIGHVTRFQHISYHDKVTDLHDTFAVESRCVGLSPTSGNQKMLDIGFQFNDIELSIDIEGEDDAIVSGGKYDSVIQQMIHEHAGPAYLPTNGLIIEQTLRATDAFARKARECRHSGPMSNERNAAGKRVRSSLRA